MNKNLYHYILNIADNNLILGQRLGELCGHGPNLETDIACTNIALDLLGQVRSYYQYATKISTTKITEDQIAMLRKEHEYKNALLVEQPNSNFAHTITRQFFYDNYHLLFLEKLEKSTDLTLAAIANKSIKEVRYHQRFSSDWVKRLGNGTEQSKTKMQEAVRVLWSYTDEFFQENEADIESIQQGYGVALSEIKEVYYNKVSKILSEATLEVPQKKYFKKGGKQGKHTEHLGFILTDLQYMQRTYPNMEW